MRKLQLRKQVAGGETKGAVARKTLVVVALLALVSTVALVKRLFAQVDPASGVATIEQIDPLRAVALDQMLHPQSYQHPPSASESLALEPMIGPQAPMGSPRSPEEAVALATITNPVRDIAAMPPQVQADLWRMLNPNPAVQPPLYLPGPPDATETRPSTAP